MKILSSNCDGEDDRNFALRVHKNAEGEQALMGKKISVSIFRKRGFPARNGCRWATIGCFGGWSIL
jgi:hypothetical protein